MKGDGLQFAFFGAVLASAGAVLAQTTLRTTTTLVVVPTLVQTTDKATAFSLAAEDFVVTDDGVPQKVTLEEETKRPLSLVVLMQTGGVARGMYASYTNLERMLELVLGGAPNVGSIVNFDSEPERACPFSSDIRQWKEAIDKPDVGNNGAAIFDAIQFALELLKKRPVTDRRAILLLSQDHDDGSTAKMKELVRELGETNTAIYAITFSEGKAAVKANLKEPHLNPPIALVDSGDGSTGEFQAYGSLDAPLRLLIGAMKKNPSVEMAALSGGEAMSFDNRAQLENDLSALNSHIRNSYVLDFYPSSQKPGLHTIKVSLPKHPELMVSARSSYWSSDSAGSVTNH